MRIKSVGIYYNEYGYDITGFKFFSKDKSLLWDIGHTTASSLKVETVELEDNEVIFGVVAKLYTTYQSLHSDFQFRIGRT